MSAWSLRTRITVLCAAVGLALGLLAVAGLTVAVTNRNQIDRLLTETGPLRTDVERLRAALVDQESAVRGYVVSGDEADLEPYRLGVAEEARLVRDMERLLIDEPAALGRLRALRQEAEGWRRDIAEPAIQAVRSGGPQPGQRLVDPSARQRFEAVRAALGQLQGSVVQLRAEAAGTARGTGNALLALLATAVVVVLGAGIALQILLSRMVIGPVTALAQQVRHLGQGDYEHRIALVGPPEVALLGRDIDVVRRRIASDLAEVRRARIALEDANRQLELQAEELLRSNRDLEQFAYVASHDLQEPLRKVASFCQLLQRRYAGQLDDKADQYIAFAVSGAQRMQRLINDLLSFSRIGRMTSGFTDVDLNRLAEEAVSQLDATREGSGAEVTWDELPVVRGEEQLLLRLLTNLVGNSVKFARQDQPARIHLSVSPAVRSAEAETAEAGATDPPQVTEWELACTDNGIGIAPEFADKVFVIFQRLHPRDAYPGTGIGLAIAKKIVEYHGGRIWLDTSYRDGARIRFTLPAVVPEPAGPQAGEAQLEEAVP